MAHIRRPRLAVQYGEEAVKLDSSQTWLKVNLGHGYLFVGRYDDAKALYLATKDVRKQSDPKTTFVEDIKDDFALFRKLGIAIPDMGRIERELGL